jgi:hypothetical protein
MRKTLSDRMVVKWIVARRGGEVKEVEEVEKVNEKTSGDFGLGGKMRGVWQIKIGKRWCDSIARPFGCVQGKEENALVVDWRGSPTPEGVSYRVEMHEWMR